MEITTSIDGTKATIVVVGKLTVATSPELEEAVHQLSDTATDFVIDLTDLEYISSAGLRVLLSAQKLMNKQGEMTITHVNDVIMEIFDVTGFTDILTIK